MQASLSRPLSTLVLVSVVSLWTSSVRAAEADAAIELAYQGRAQFEAGHFRQALELFERAREQASSPTLDLYVARCHKALGQWVEALRFYRLSLAAPQVTDNEAWQAAQASARSEVAELEAKLPRLTLRAPSGQEPPQVFLDGSPLTWPVVRVAVDPGRHVLVARYAAGTTTREFVALASEPVEFDLAIPPSAEGSRSDRQTSVASPPSKSSSSSATSSGEGPSRATWAPWIWSSGVLAGLGIVAGSATGGAAFATADDVRSWCSSNGGCDGGEITSAEVRERRDLSATLGDISTVSFIAAGVFTAATVTLLVLQPRDARASVSSASGAPRFEFHAGHAATLQFRGSF